MHSAHATSKRSSGSDGGRRSKAPLHHLLFIISAHQSLTGYVLNDRPSECGQLLGKGIGSRTGRRKRKVGKAEQGRSHAISYRVLLGWRGVDVWCTRAEIYVHTGLMYVECTSFSLNTQYIVVWNIAIRLGYCVLGRVLDSRLLDRQGPLTPHVCRRVCHRPSRPPPLWPQATGTAPLIQPA